jgi:Protein of unknown function (DUF2950)
MNPTIKRRGTGRKLSIAGALVLAAALGMPGLVQAQAPYDKVEQAADALVSGLATSDEAALATVLGKGWRPLMGLEDINTENRFIFLEKASQSRSLTVTDGRAHLTVGSDPWVLPVPIVQGKDGKWRFDPVAGREEILERQIGANELAAMQAVLATVDAQREYALRDRNGDGLLEYAQKIISSPGKRDGLIWSDQLGEESPLGDEFLPAKPGAGYHGYRFRVLSGQGPKAPGGARSYLIGARMVAGFALVAWPVQYGKTGVMSFMVNSAGAVYERDLGPQTAQAVEAIKLFNPDEGWKPAKP